MAELKPFKTVVVGDYTATKQGNNVIVRRKDGARLWICVDFLSF